MQKKIKN